MWLTGLKAPTKELTNSSFVLFLCQVILFCCPVMWATCLFFFFLFLYSYVLDIHSMPETLPSLTFQCRVCQPSVAGKVERFARRVATPLHRMLRGGRMSSVVWFALTLSLGLRPLLIVVGAQARGTAKKTFFFIYSVLTLTVS